MRKKLVEGEVLEHIDYSGKGITGEFDSCSFVNCNFSDADLQEVDFMECTFENCNFSNAVLKNTGFKNVQFTQCKMLGLHFESCNPFLLEMHFDTCLLNFATFYQLKLQGLTNVLYKRQILWRPTSLVLRFRNAIWEVLFLKTPS